MVPARAADMGPFEAAETGTPSGWQFTVAPYVWAAGISGDVAQFGLPSSKLDMSFSDILKDLDISGMMVTEARYDRFSVVTDFSYVKTTTDEGTPFGILATGVKVTSETLRMAALGGYQILGDENFRVDLNAGLQLTAAKTKMRFIGGILNGVRGTDSDVWVDGLVGFRARANLTEKLFMSGWANIGAGESDLVWDVMGGVGYNFTPSISGFAGYRASGIDYNKGGFVYDVVQHGPITGLVFRF
ncbi:MAG: hypothetical protein C0606_05425 [Hyphomicrobiales bacterium]|nr:MAG: hypothetical protein C0606_05425 [Hyphomicrobiales bacterium]